MTKERLDILVQRLAGVSRSKAQGLIHTGQVVDAAGNRLDKPGQRYADDIELTIKEQPKYVSRGGEKLEGAFDKFPLEVEGLIAIDVGASTGGFTDCLLQRGAAKIYAVDVGYGQLAWKIREDTRVVVMERTNIRHLKPEALDDRPSFFVVDCSFISLKMVLPPLMPLLNDDPQGVVLIKPQFEAGREQVGKGGVVRDQAVRDQVVEDIRDTARTLGFTKIDVVSSPLLGPAGNQEFLAWLRGYERNK